MLVWLVCRCGFVLGRNWHIESIFWYLFNSKIMHLYVYTCVHVNAYIGFYLYIYLIIDIYFHVMCIYIYM